MVDDIKKTLLLQDAPCHVGSFDRPNIFYKVKYKDSVDTLGVDGALGDLCKFITKQHQRCQTRSEPCAGIVYSHTRQKTEEIADTIHKRTGIVTEAYHAGLKAAERLRVQNAWTSGDSPIVVATVSFGMGYATSST